MCGRAGLCIPELGGGGGGRRRDLRDNARRWKEALRSAVKGKGLLKSIKRVSSGGPGYISADSAAVKL